MNKKFTIITLLIFLLLANRTYSCSCGKELDFKYLSDNTDQVFLASARSFYRFKSFSKNQIDFLTVKNLKGQSKDDFRVWSKKGGSSCGLKVLKGEIYLVHAYYEKDQLLVDRCSTFRLGDLGQVDLDNLKKAYDKITESDLAP